MVWDHENSISFSYFLNKKHVSETFLYTVVMNNSLNSFKLTISSIRVCGKISEQRLIPKYRILFLKKHMQLLFKFF